jgi:hypothetical protein
MKSTSLLIFAVALLAAIGVQAQPSNGNGKGNGNGATGNSGNGNSAGANNGAGNSGAGNSGASSNGSAGGNGGAGTLRQGASKFELPRIKASGKGSGAEPVAKGRATVHDLSSGGKANARAGKSQNVDYLAIDPNTSWSTTIRGGIKDTTFVSFFLCASVGTSIDIAGAKILIREGKTADTVRLQIGHPGVKGMAWRDFGGPVRLERYNGAALAALPVLTLRLDGSAGIWDIFVGGRLASSDLPLRPLPVTASKEFFVHAGNEGVMVCGLVSSDDNPLFTDENRNGIEDGFERQHNSGGLLTLPGKARMLLAQNWVKSQQAAQARTQTWAVQRPQPDKAPASPPGKGK